MNSPIATSPRLIVSISYLWDWNSDIDELGPVFYFKSRPHDLTPCMVVAIYELQGDDGGKSSILRWKVLRVEIRIFILTHYGFETIW
ncbi:unnamed protein product [Linum trigynum]|uniref:Uncharacterized protein n=1 Tax=Linum trigynum TaxID=586398 RepID=A0AAV2CHX5_9ROSI